MKKCYVGHSKQEEREENNSVLQIEMTLSPTNSAERNKLEKLTQSFATSWSTRERNKNGLAIVWLAYQPTLSPQKQQQRHQQPTVASIQWPRNV